MSQISTEWTFLTNHTHVLLVISMEESIVLRNVAQKVGITERAVQKIVRELEDSGYLIRSRVGRGNRYEINVDKPLRHPLEAHNEIGDLLKLLKGKQNSKK